MSENPSVTHHWTPDSALPVSDSALALVRAKFNPSNLQRVDTIKLLAAALITIAEENRETMPKSARHAALGVTAVEEAAMWLVKAATTES